MADTIKKQIIQDILTALANILVSNGFETNLGQNVLATRKQVDPDILPFVVIWPQIEEATAVHGRSNQDFPLQIEGHAAFGAAEPWAVAEDMQGDIIKLMTSKSAKPTPLADSIVYTEGGVDEYPEPGEIAIAVRVNFNIRYKTLAGNPFNQT